MNATLRRLGPEESDLELLTLGASAGGLAYAGVWMASGLPVPQCAFRAITGCPCPTCGATHCVLALLHGHVAQAFAWNPMVFAGLAALALFNVYAAAVLMGSLPRVRLRLGRWESRLARAGAVAMVALNWAYEVHHFCGGIA
jgi:hypothetical protein